MPVLGGQFKPVLGGQFKPVLGGQFAWIFHSIMKDVKFEGTDKWIKRNEYLLNRTGK